jgi:predicted nucleotidyltransferase
MRYGLKEHSIQAIRNVFEQFPGVEKVILYGSRAKGTYRPNSDIDVTLLGPQLSLSEQFKIETALDDLLLPYKMDLSIYHKIETLTSSSTLPGLERCCMKNRGPQKFSVVRTGQTTNSF